MKQKLIDYANNEIKRQELEQNLNKETEARNQLQTKYDMEVRSKEELANELKNIRPKVISKDEELVLTTLKNHAQSSRQKGKEILDKAGFNKSKLGNYSLPFSGYTAYYYLYYDWTVPSE
jgi:ABC-type oligopeptide transport system ATPase subunit